MRLLRTLGWLLSVLVALAVCIVFYSQNLRAVVVEFAYWSSPKMPLASALLASFAVGVLAAGVYFLLDVLRLRSQVRKSRRLAELLERELEALRNAPLYDELPSTPTIVPTSFEQHLTHEGQPEASIDLLEPKRFR